MKKLLSLVGLFLTLEGQATHITGGQITSRCLNGLTQEITLTLYRDIQGLPISNSVPIDYVSNNFTWNVTRYVTHGQPYMINPTTEAYDFVDTITLPYVDFYTFSYTTCCRLASIININNPSPTMLYIDATAYVNSNCNSTPIIAVIPYNNAIVNTTHTIPISATDPDNDSLGYSLTSTMDGAGMNTLGYISIPGTISSNGTITMTPTIMGVYVVNVKVTEYKNGVEVGYVRREFQVSVGTTTGIEELNVVKNYNSLYYDLLGRNVNLQYRGVKIYSK